MSFTQLYCTYCNQDVQHEDVHLCPAMERAGRLARIVDERDTMHFRPGDMSDDLDEDPDDFPSCENSKEENEEPWPDDPHPAEHMDRWDELYSNIRYPSEYDDPYPDFYDEWAM